MLKKLLQKINVFVLIKDPNRHSNANNEIIGPRDEGPKIRTDPFSICLCSSNLYFLH